MNDTKNKQTRNVYLKNYVIVIFILLTICFLVGTIKYLNKIEITQLKDSTSSQMMGYIIKTKTGKVIAVDGGTRGDSTNLEEQIEKLGGKVDYWFITHPHIDHMGAFLEIKNNTQIQINKIYTTYNEPSWYLENAKERENETGNAIEFINTLNNGELDYKKVSLNEEFYIDNIKCEILGIANPEITQNPVNNSSMVIKMQVNDKSIIFLGDTGVESGEKLLQNQSSKLKANVVQMAHHGQSGVNEEVYKKINPEICLWPTPNWLWNNDIGTGENSGTWKTMETRSWMNNLNVKQNIVEKDGNIAIEIF